MLHRLYNIVRQWLWEHSEEGRRRLFNPHAHLMRHIPR